MQWRDRLRLGLRTLSFHRRESERLRAEMQLHLDGLIAENIAAGMSPEDARYAAMRAFGNATVVSEQTQATWGWTWLEQVTQDLRYAARQLMRSPGFVLVTVLTLTLGIGANTAAGGSGGVRSENNFFATVDVRPQTQRSVALTHLYWQLADRMQDMPGIQSVSSVAVPPFRGAAGGQFSAVPGSGEADAAVKQQVLFNEISANFFRELGVPILAGRDFMNSDVDANTCIVSQAAVRKFFSHGTALGGTLRQYQMSMDTGTSSTDDCEVIGVVADAKLMDLRRPAEATIYRPITGDFSNPGLWNFVIQAHSLADARNAYLKVLHELAPGKPEFDLIPFTVQLDDSVSIERLLAQLSAFFAGLALLLSGIGIYGLVAWNVTQRTREIGVRMALGATRLRVLALVMRQVAVLLAVGVLTGGLGAFFAARSIRSFLFEVQPGSPAIFAASALGLVVVGLLAAMLPARRAASIDPMQALRTE